jgi:hypothetical protein
LLGVPSGLPLPALGGSLRSVISPTLLISMSESLVVVRVKLLLLYNYSFVIQVL